MFKEILKITPKLDAAALSTMERSLTSRFSKVAKGFGKGLVGALKGGGLIGIGLSIVDKILNPLKETQDSIDKSIGDADNVVTNSEQFNSDPGELFKLQKLAQAKGLDAEALNNLILKFQGAVSEAAADPEKPTSVRAFAKDTNMVQAFYEFIQSLNKMDRKDQVVVQNEVFGEKQTLKMADFLRTDFKGLEKRIGVGNSDSYTPSLIKLGALNDRKDEGTAKLEARDVLTKGKIINSPMIDARLQADQIEKQKENQRIVNYKNLQSISDTVNIITKKVEEGVFLLGGFIAKVTPMINRLVDKIDSLSKTGVMRGIFGSWYDKDK